MTQGYVPHVSPLTTGRAIDILLAGLIDYAGLYPPAGLDMHSAVQNYLLYRQSRHEHVLGRFIVNIHRTGELRAIAGDDLADVKVSVIVPPNPDWSPLSALLKTDLHIQAVEFKIGSPTDFESVIQNMPREVDVYVEVPVGAASSSALKAISDAGAHAKLRMGGVVAEAFPPAHAVAVTLTELAAHHIPFKATSGLHHPIRSRHHFTYELNSPAGMMHGFINLFCAAALAHFGGQAAEATRILEEEDPHAWHLTPDAITWRSHRWRSDQLLETRKKFFLSCGCCSFTEPIHDLEALGWL